MSSLHRPQVVLQLIFCLTLLLSGCGNRLMIELLEAEVISLRERSIRKLQHKGFPANAVRWESSNPAVAKVDNLGYVTAMAVGKTTVSVIHKSNSRLRDSLSIEVIPAIAIKLTPEAVPVLKAGNSVQLQATVEGSDNQAVNWSSSNPGVASMAENGLVQALSAGTALVSATSQADPTAKAELEVSVIAEPTIEVGLVLTPSTKQSLFVGQTLQLQSLVTGSTNQAVSWDSDASQVAGVDSVGLVRAINPGQAFISATSQADSRVRASLEIEVLSVPAPVVQVRLLPSTPQQLRIGQSLQISAEVLGSENQALSWSSDNPQIAEVQNGLVSAKGLGIATITATAQADPSSKASLELSVIEAPVVSIEPSTRQTLLVNETRQFSASVSGSPNQLVTWSSDHPEIARIDSSGLVQAIASGPTTIRATSQADPDAQASVRVDVVDTVIELGTP
jgi:uncharacterized protein YjdB